MYKSCVLHCQNQIPTFSPGMTRNYDNLYVPIGGDSFIRTITLSPESPPVPPSPPLVMVHGFGAGLGCFFRNFEGLAMKRRLFAFDVLGFGRSTRSTFSTDPERVEDEFVESIEKWREAMGLEKMILLGHSLGAFMSSSYAMKYPER